MSSRRRPRRFPARRPRRQPDDATPARPLLHARARGAAPAAARAGALGRRAASTWPPGGAAAPSSSSTAPTRPATTCGAWTGSPSLARASRSSSSSAPRRTSSCGSSWTRARRSTSGEPSKILVAKRLAAAIGYMALASSERAQVLAAGEGRVRMREPVRGRGCAREAPARARRRLRRRSGTDLASAIDGVVLRSPRPGMLVVVSDFLDAGPFDAALGRAAAAGHDLALVQVLAPEELEPPWDGDLALEDAETGDGTRRHARRACRRGVSRDASEAWSRSCAPRRRGTRATYVRVPTGEPLLDAVRRFVAAHGGLSHGGPAPPRSEGTPATGRARPARRPLHPQDQAAPAARLVDLALGGGAARPRREAPLPQARARAAAPARDPRARTRWHSPSRRPSTRGGAIDGDHVAIVVDTSASMATRIGGADRSRRRAWIDAKRAAQDVVSRSSRPGRTPSSSRRRAKRGWWRRPSAIRAGCRPQSTTVGGPRRRGRPRRRAVALAADRLRSLGGRQRIVVVTDGALAHDEPLVVAGVPTEVVGVGDDEDNAAIVRVDVRSGLDAVSHREQVQVFAMVESCGAHPREAYVTLAIEGRSEPVASRRLLLAARRQAPGGAHVRAAAGGPRCSVCVVQLAPGDAEPVDDVAFGRVPGSLRMPVVVASDCDVLVDDARASRPIPNVELQRLAVAQLATVNVDPDALVVVEGACPATVPGRDVLVLARRPGLLLRDRGGCGRRRSARSRRGRPAIHACASSRSTAFTLRDRPTLDAQGAGASLVRSSSTTLIADASLPGRTVTLVGFDPGASDWPLKASFVLFVRNVVELARAPSRAGCGGALAHGRAGARVRAGRHDEGDRRRPGHARARDRRAGRLRDPAAARAGGPLSRAVERAPRRIGRSSPRT